MELVNPYQALKTGCTPPVKQLKKLGTVKIGVVETTPVVWKGDLLRFEWVRNSNWCHIDTIAREVGCFHFVNMANEEPTPEFAEDHSFGSCIVEDDTMFVVGTRGPGGGNVLDMFWSKDLENWEEKRDAIVFSEDLNVYNTSICKGPNGYVMAIELGAGGKPHPIVGKGFTNVFAVSQDLKNWELLDMYKYLYDPSRYTACPVIRYIDGYYYIINLEHMPGHRWVPYIVRTPDLEHYEFGMRNPVMFFDDQDKMLYHPERFTEEDKQTILNAVDCNNSDVDFCDYNGKTVILYSWGNQGGAEYLAMAEYDGTSEEFVKSFFTD